jgi:uncharacterized protein (TIGR00299 family) protein
MHSVLFLDLFSGAGGDMLLGALLDAGLPLEELQAELAKMDLAGYELEVERQVRHGLSGTKLHVRDVAHEHPARHLPDIQRLIQGSALSPQVQKSSLAVFERLARVEAGIHGLSIDQVHFHEISAVDSLVDIVGFIAGLERLQVEHVFASSVPLGSGTIETAHGLIPVPAPATLALLAEVGAPTRPHPAQTEIVTPTAAALLAELATFERPPMRVWAVGFGFGQKEFPWANAVRAWLGEIEAGIGEKGRSDQVVLLECNLDDVTGETLGYTMEQLFIAGALDVWFTPIQMKKNRPAVVLSALVHSEQADSMAQIILRETSTLGLRTLPMERIVAERHIREVETLWGRVRVKEKWLAGERIAISPEYEDCARIARAQSIPLHQVFDAAKKAATGFEPAPTPAPPTPATGQ